MREIAEAGIFARVYDAPTPGDRPAVVVFDGSGGGYPADEAAMAALAEAGHPTLAVAYFRNRLGIPDGAPAVLSEIPLEYGLRCVRWAGEHLGGRSHGVVVMGHSRGSELALLVATRVPDLRGVVAVSPSDAVWQSNTFGVEPKSAWSEAGHALPFRRFAVPPGQWPVDAEISSAYVEEVPGASIPAEDIACPVLLIASRADRIWPSAKMADAIADRMRRHGNPPQNLQFDDASHILMGFGDAPTRVVAGDFSLDLGGTEDGTRAARDTGWQAVLDFLREVGS